MRRGAGYIRLYIGLFNGDFNEVWSVVDEFSRVYLTYFIAYYQLVTSMDNPDHWILYRLDPA